MSRLREMTCLHLMDRCVLCRLRKRSVKADLAKKAVKKAIDRHSSRRALRKKIADLRVRLSEFLSGFQLEFVMSQLKCATKSAKGFRWTVKDKSFALSIYHSGPKTYRLLKKVFSLPSIATLKRVMRRVKVYPGFNDAILEALRMKTQSLPASSKIVVLVIDEMAIKEGLSYDQGRDVIEGFAEGLERTHQLANHAIAFMVRGVIEKWKQCFGYFLSCGAMPGGEIKELVFQAIRKLRSIGLTVLALISDQGTNNQNLFETNLKMTREKPYFFLDDSKVFLLYDPPHLLKSVRNNFKKWGYTMDGKDVSWSHLQEFYDQDASKPIRMAPRLTKRHLDLPPFANLRVSLAAQVLSHSVAAGMAVMAQWNIISEEASHTAAFIDEMDKLFNVFNSRTASSKAQMQHAVSESSNHKEFLTEKLKWFDDVKSKGKRKPACLRGWPMAISCLLQMWEFLHKDHGVQFLLTSRLNQDCLENFFSSIRAKGAQRDNPDSAQFRAAIAQVMVDAVMIPSSNKNCSEDVDEFLLTLSSLDKVEGQSATFVPTPSPYEAMLDQLPYSVRNILSVCTPWSQEEQNTMSLQETNVLSYIAGYIVRKIRKAICPDCLSNITSTISEHDENHSLLNQKVYKEAKDGLIAPSDVLLDVVTNVEAEYRKIIDDVIYSDQVKTNLVGTITKKVALDGISCPDCHTEALVVRLMVNVRLHHTLKEANRSLAISKDRKNRKTLKFSHL